MVKLDKHRLGKLWVNGGRTPHKWCNYHLDTNIDGKYYLIERANKKAWLLWLLLLPIQLITLVVLLVATGVLKLAEMVVDGGWSEVSINPIICVNSTIFNKGAIRKDEVADTQEDLGKMVSCIKTKNVIKDKQEIQDEK